MKFTFGFVVVMGLIFSSVVSSAKENSKTIVFRVAHGPYEVINEPLQVFKKEVEDKTNGHLKIQIQIPANVKETNPLAVKKTFQDVMSGEIQLSQIYSFYMSKFDPNFYALEMPFLFRDHDHAYATVDGEPGTQLLTSLEAKSPLKGLGFTYCGGYRSIASKNLKIEAIEDFKKLKMSPPSSPVTRAIFAEMGSGIVNNIYKEDVLSALAKNEINGFETVSPRYFHNGDYKTANILNDLNHSIQFTVIVMNKKFFNSLTKKEQKIISEASFKASLVERKLAIQVASDVQHNASKYGVSIVKMPEAELNKFKDMMNKVDWYSKFGISKEFVEKINGLATKKLSFKM